MNDLIEQATLLMKTEGLEQGDMPSLDERILRPLMPLNAPYSEGETPLFI